MKHPLALIFTLAAILCLPVLAGTLDHAPFHVVLPDDAGWKLDDAKPQEVAKNLSIVASLLNAKNGLTSTVMTGPITPGPNALEEICEGIRDSFSNPALKKLWDSETVFVGFNAQSFAFEMVQQEQTTYNEGRVFVVGDTAWLVSFAGPLAQKDAVQQMAAFYRRKKP